MKRNVITEAVILRNNRVGEIHKGLILLTQDLGLISAIAHGAYKPTGKLKGVSDPFCHVQAFIYHEPVKHTYKVTDMAVKHFFEGIRGELKKFYIASVWAEIIMKSFGGGESSNQVFDFLVAAYSLLDRMAMKYLDYVQIQFLWRYFSLLGLKPQLHRCSSCGRIMEDRDAMVLSSKEAAFLCSQCGSEGMRDLSPGSRRYLLHTGTLDFEKAVEIELGSRSLGELKTIVYLIIEDIIGTRLKSLSSGAGIL